MAPWSPEKKEISCEEEREKAGAWQETRRLSMSGVMTEGYLSGHILLPSRMRLISLKIPDTAAC